MLWIEALTVHNIRFVDDVYLDYYWRVIVVAGKQCGTCSVQTPAVRQNFEPKKYSKLKDVQRIALKKILIITTLLYIMLRRCNILILTKT